MASSPFGPFPFSVEKCFKHPMFTAVHGGKRSLREFTSLCRFNATFFLEGYAFREPLKQFRGRSGLLRFPLPFGRFGWGHRQDYRQALSRFLLSSGSAFAMPRFCAKRHRVE